MKKLYTCEVCGKVGESKLVSKRFGKYLCNKHYAQLRNYGEFTDLSPLTQGYGNEIREKDNYAEVVLRDNKRNITGIAIIDIDDIDLIKKHSWHMFHGYAITNNKNYNMFMHREIMHYSGDLDIDHINRNKLDNRKSNLRIVTRKINAQNKGRSNGINIYKSRNKWEVRIKRYGKNIYKGGINTFEDAVVIRNSMLDELDSTYGALNQW